MKKVLFAVLSVFACVQLAGCSGWAIRSSSSLEPRVDQEVKGNRGTILGETPSEPKEPSFTERKVYKIEVELPRWPKDLSRDWKKVKKGLTPGPRKQRKRKDTTLWGNKGYLFGGSGQGAAEEITMPYLPEEKKVKQAAVVEIEASEALPEKTPRRRYKTRKGDTLQKISRRFYGTTKKWPLIYKANRNKLKGPDKVYPGQVLNIPEAGEFKK